MRSGDSVGTWGASDMTQQEMHNRKREQNCVIRTEGARQIAPFLSCSLHTIASASLFRHSTPSHWTGGDGRCSEWQDGVTRWCNKMDNRASQSSHGWLAPANCNSSDARRIGAHHSAACQESTEVGMRCARFAHGGGGSRHPFPALLGRWSKCLMMA